MVTLGTRTSNARSNIIVGYITRIIDLFLPFVVRTIIIYVLGETYVGLSSLFTSILNMLNMTELGFSSAVVFSLYKPLAEGDDEKVKAYMTFYKKIYRAIGIVIFVLGLLLVPVLRYIIKGEIPLGVNLHVIYIIYLINTAVSYLAFAYKASLLQASQKMSINSKISSFVTCFRSVIQIVVLLITRSFYLYALVLVVSTLANNLLVNYTVNKMYPQYIADGKLEKADRKTLLTNVSGLAISKVCGVMRDSLDSITLSAFIGLTSVAIYGNYFYVLSAVHGLMVVITVAIRAGVGNSICTESVEKNTNDMLKFHYIYMFIASWCFACLVCLYQDFMLLWVGAELKTNNFTMVLFAVYFYSLCIGDMRNVYIEAIGMWWEYRYRSIIETIANLVLNVLFVYLWGISGVLIATLITFWGINLIYGSSIIFRKYFGVKALKNYILQNVVILFSCVFATTLTYGVCQIVVFDNLWMQLLIKIIICCIVPVWAYILLNLKNAYMREIPRVIKKFLRKI